MASVGGRLAKVMYGSVVVAGIGEWSMSGFVPDVVEDTAFGDTVKKWTNAGIADAGEVSFTGNYDPADTAGQVALNALATSDVRADEPLLLREHVRILAGGHRRHHRPDRSAAHQVHQEWPGDMLLQGQDQCQGHGKGGVIYDGIRSGREARCLVRHGGRRQGAAQDPDRPRRGGRSAASRSRRSRSTRSSTASGSGSRSRKKTTISRTGFSGTPPSSPGKTFRTARGAKSPARLKTRRSSC